MLDFDAVRNKTISFNELIAGLGRAELATLTEEMVDAMLALIAECTDADVIFVPDDPDAEDTFAENQADIDLAWTLGHVIVHTTASAEESAFLAAELARGVEFHGRSRWEVPWQQATTIEFCRQRLEESRHMRLASLVLWPDPPHLKNTYQSRPDGPTVNAVARFVYGLAHDDSHLGQIAEIVRQAQTARRSQ